MRGWGRWARSSRWQWSRIVRCFSNSISWGITCSFSCPICRKACDACMRTKKINSFFSLSKKIGRFPHKKIKWLMKTKKKGLTILETLREKKKTAPSLLLWAFQTIELREHLLGLLLLQLDGSRSAQETHGEQLLEAQCLHQEGNPSLWSGILVVQGKGKTIQTAKWNQAKRVRRSQEVISQ